MDVNPSLEQLLRQQAQKAGFPLAGGVDLGPQLDDPTSQFHLHLKKYSDWLEAGKAGAMEYLRRGLEFRSDPRKLFPGAKSIFCVAIPYSATPMDAGSSEYGPRYARYIRGEDYHLSIRRSLEDMMKQIQLSWPDLRYKVCVDTSAVLEKTWAALAGLGWIGKNTLLIHPQYGSYLFLAEVLLSEEMGVSPKPLPSYCGSCTRCLDVCPTAALSAPGELDSRSCISYLTLEKRGEFEVDSDRLQQMGSWVAGCDLCQEVCPFNTKPSKRSEPTGPADFQSWEEALLESEESYRKRVKTSALNRVKPAQFRRNLATALGNVARSWNGDRDRLKKFQSLVELRHQQETDPVALAQWARCLELVRTQLSDSP